MWPWRWPWYDRSLRRAADANQAPGGLSALRPRASGLVKPDDPDRHLRLQAQASSRSPGISDGPKVRRQRLVLAAVLAQCLIIIACPVVIVQVFVPEARRLGLERFPAAWAEQKWVLWTVAAAFLLSIVGKPLLWAV